MEVPIVIRSIHAVNQVSADDLVAINRLLDQLSPKTVHQFNHETLIALLIKSPEFLVARDMAKDGLIIGTGTLAKVAKATRWQSEIHDVVVDMSYQGQGIGKSLVLRLIESAQEDKRLSHIELTSKPSRVAANALYLSLGFKLVAVANPEFGDQGTNLYRFKL